MSCGQPGLEASHSYIIKPCLNKEVSVGQRGWPVFQAPLITCPVCSWPTKRPLGQSLQQHPPADTSCHMRTDEINRSSRSANKSRPKLTVKSQLRKGMPQCLLAYFAILDGVWGSIIWKLTTTPEYGNSVPEKHSRIKLKGRDFSRLGQQ